VVLSSLYLPVVLMLIGLTLRGVAFDFRVKGQAAHKPLWNHLFWIGSVITAVSQGFMLGSYITGFDSSVGARTFAVLTAVCVPAVYALLGAGWLLIKTAGRVQLKAVYWARRAWWGALTGFVAVSIASPLVSQRIFDKWLTLPYIVLLAPLPVVTLLLLFISARSLRRLPTRLQQGNDYGAWVPFAATIGVVVIGFYGLAYSLFPYLVVDRITIWDAASAPESLQFILTGTAIVLPAILGYTIYVYRVFRGKAEPLSYG
jgi:cytochrome d ubiquinol oxidase subunit II